MHKSRQDVLKMIQYLFFKRRMCVVDGTGATWSTQQKFLKMPCVNSVQQDHTKRTPLNAVLGRSSVMMHTLESTSIIIITSIVNA